MMRADVQGVDFVVANTDAQALNTAITDRRIQLGLKITQGLGAGSRPEIGRAAAEETIDEISQALEGAHMTDRYAIARHEELVGPVNLPADRF